MTTINLIVHLIGLVLGLIVLVRVLRETKFNFIDVICIGLGALLLLF